MAISTPSEAVRTAAERLEAIEVWSKRTFIASVVSASCLVIMAAATLYMAFLYVRITQATREMSAQFQRDVKSPARPKLVMPTVRPKRAAPPE